MNPDVAAEITVDGIGNLCVTLILELRRRITAAPAGTLVRVVADDPAAPLDLPAWCHLTGHDYVGVVGAQDGVSVYGIRTVVGPRGTDPAHPWRTTNSSGPGAASRN